MRGPSADVGIVDEFQVATLAGRGFGKTARREGYVSEGGAHIRSDRTSGNVGSESTVERRAATAHQQRKRPNQRAVLRNWRRRYEQEPDTRLRKQPAAARVECPHAEVIWLERPHPKYGDAQPHFVRRVVPVEGNHDCVYGAV